MSKLNRGQEHETETDHTRLPADLAVTGDLVATQDIVIDGYFDGRIAVPDHHVSISRSASVRAKIVARSVTIHGSLDGSVLASETVEVLPGASVRGHLTTPSIRLADGAEFTGTIDPEKSKTPTNIALFRRHRE